MRVIFLGSGAFALPTLRWLVESEHDIALVVTQPARKAGRGRRVTPTPVAQCAKEAGLTTVETPEVNGPELVERFRSLDARIGLVIDFGQKLGPELLASMPGGCINLHASLLPKYRGAAPINRAIVNGEERTGCTVFRIIQRMDAGPILTSLRTAIEPEETAGELHDRLAALGVDAVEAALSLYAGPTLPEGTAQVEADTTHAPKLKKADGIIRFDQPVQRVANHICGMTPWPGARTRFEAADGRWEDIAITRARPAIPSPPAPIAEGGVTAAQRPAGRSVRDQRGVGQPDACAGSTRAESLDSHPTVQPGVLDTRLYVAARDGFVELLEIKPSSGRLMTWQDYVNGRRVAPGDRFVTPRR